MDGLIETVPILQSTGRMVYVPVSSVTQSRRHPDNVGFYVAGLTNGIQIAAAVGILVYLMFGSRK